ncbi:MAG: pyridoxamine 5'-phosphate oxidase family protein [Anaerolineae bacterium]|nr:pyridoxamine 5'-phosphate oxidase family protein [Anaerolineae bacterium]
MFPISFYHLRRSEKALVDRAALVAIIRRQKYMTLAMCDGGVPYLVTVNYGFDVQEDCFYFHCAREGRKLDILRAHPVVWGQVLEDLGYCEGKCDHAFRTVQFRGTVSFLSSREAKQRALFLMIDQLEADPEPVKARFLDPAALERVMIGCLQVEMLSGKENLKNL